MESLPEEEQELSALHCNPDLEHIMTQLLILWKLKHLPGVQGSLGHTSKGGLLAQVLDVLPWAVSYPRPPSAGNNTDWLVATTPLTTTPTEVPAVSLVSALPAAFIVGQWDPIPWLGSECSGNFPNLVCSNEITFMLYCMLICRDPSETGKGFLHFRKIRKI